MMNRRAFFGVLAAGLAAAVDPELLLWVPGRKLISIPKPRNLGLFGIKFYEINSNAGNYMGIPREPFPGSAWRIPLAPRRGADMRSEIAIKDTFFGNLSCVSFLQASEYTAKVDDSNILAYEETIQAARNLLNATGEPWLR